MLISVTKIANIHCNMLFCQLNLEFLLNTLSYDAKDSCKTYHGNNRKLSIETTSSCDYKLNVEHLKTSILIFFPLLIMLDIT